MFGKNKTFKINEAAFQKNAVHIDARQDWDSLFAALEQAMSRSQYVLVDQCLHDDGIAQVLCRFVSRYKMFIDTCHIDVSVAGGRCYMKARRTLISPEGGSYADLQDSYTESYYLDACGGYDRFLSSGGQDMEPRLQSVLALVDPKPGEKILDIGCGRGEMSYALARAGASVTGVDYSPDAIRIARRTYDPLGGGISLKFIQNDIFLLEDLETYDKMVMADVVEHIEQDVLERIFQKLSDSLSPTGLLVIHTAPNRNFYDYVYPARRQRAASVGCFLPKEPRYYYEHLTHINEQTPLGLQRALERYFPFVHVWTSGDGPEEQPPLGLQQALERHLPYAHVWTNFDGPAQDQDKADLENDAYFDIFAYAANDRGALENALSIPIEKPAFDACHIRLHASGFSVALGQTTTIEVTLENLGSENITSRRKYPIFLSYHILDHDGQVLVFDGMRSIIPLNVGPGGSRKVSLVVDPPALPKGSYTLRVTCVSEGLFWLDSQGGNFTDVPMTVV